MTKNQQDTTIKLLEIVLADKIEERSKANCEISNVRETIALVKAKKTKG